MTTRPRPASSRRNWSVSGWVSSPIDSPTGMDITVTCRYRPVQATVRYVVVVDRQRLDVEGVRAWSVVVHVAPCVV
jgi:hypothetical protein